MNYIIKEPNKPAKYGCIEQTDALGELHALQALVGGNIEVWDIKGRFAMIVNEESRINDMPFNLTLWGEQFFGPVIFIGVCEGNFTDLPFTMCELKRMIPQLADQPSKDGKPNADGWVAYNRKNEATYPDSKWVLVQDWNAFMYGAKFDRATGGWLDLHDEWHSGDSIAAWHELPPVYEKEQAMNKQYPCLADCQHLIDGTCDEMECIWKEAVSAKNYWATQQCKNRNCIINSDGFCVASALQKCGNGGKHEVR